MGVDYDGVGGIGIEITDYVIDKLINYGLFTRDEWEDDYDFCLSKIGFVYELAGNGSYTGRENDRYYCLVPGSNLMEIVANKMKFIKRFEEFGIMLDDTSLIVISDFRVW